MTDVFDCDQAQIKEQRIIDRRADWHTPNDCFKLLDVQKAMDSIFKKLHDGDIRMGCVEDNIAGNHRIVSQDIKSIEAMLAEHKKELTENTAKTNEIFEIVQMGKGVFKFFFLTGKWLRRIIMWVVPPVAAIVGLWQSIRPPK